MKITLTENKLRSLIKEAIIKHLNEDITNNGISVSNEELEQKIKNGEDPEDIFDYVDDDFYNGYAKVYLNRKINFIDKFGNILSKQWFDDALNFKEDYVLVVLKGKYNFIDKQGNILSKKWFDEVYNFYNDYAKVCLNGKWILIDKQGKFYASIG